MIFIKNSSKKTFRLPGNQRLIRLVKKSKKAQLDDLPHNLSPGIIISLGKKTNNGYNATANTCFCM